MYVDRVLPHNPEAEEAVVGSILIDEDALTKVTSIVQPSNFYQAKVRWCYEACLALFDRREAINQVTLAQELALRERLEEVGGPAYVAHLVRTVPTSVHVEHYAEIVRRAFIMRELIRTADSIAQIGYEGTSDVDGALSEAERLLFNIRSGRGTRDFLHIREVLDTYMEENASLEVDRDQHLAPVPTGFNDIDKLLGGGLQRSDLVVIAARPSLGKSTLAFNIAHHAAERGMVAGIFSLEMSAEQIAIRLVSGVTGINSHYLRMGLLSEAQKQQEYDGLLSELPIYIDDTPFQTIVDVRGKARRLQSEHSLDLLIVDYIQLISGSSGKSENRVQDVAEISRSLKGIARDLDVPVIALSQLSRAPEQRPNHRPMLSDLRESGSIEQDADIVAFIFREDKYITKEEWERKNPNDAYPQNIVELIVAKHRNGPTGSIPLYFREDIVSFENLAHTQGMREYA